MFHSRKGECCALLMLAASLSGALGCASSSTSNTARTSVEQLLVANAVDQSLDKCNFASFQGQNVYLQDKYVECVDKNYVIASTRHRLFRAGAKLVDSPDKADVVVELRAGAVGTTSATSFVGTPQLSLPGMLTIPEIKLMERRRQQAVAKLGMVAYDPQTNEVLGAGGMSLASSNDNNWFMLGVGPYQNGSVRKEVQRSTTGPAAKSQGQLPVTVAFASPVRHATPDDTQLAAEPVEDTGVSPASHAEAPATPEWAR
ncbi:DUF6655 family protein [Planctomicrobium sp. SH661]|uniref:DUF6655 family protein n=1 Tax=Planctomicrobium sp. SH661 TaxID=3448124 RepID=UPI003F5B87BC